MTIEILLVFGLLALAVVLFTTEIVPFDIAALIPTGVLLLVGVLTPEEGFAGFSNAATATVGAMFVLSAGIHRTGALNIVSTYLTDLGRQNYYVALSLMMVSVGVISADTSVNISVNETSDNVRGDPKRHILCSRPHTSTPSSRRRHTPQG